MKYFSTFSGIGGFERGMDLAYESLCNAHGGENRGSKENQEGNQRQRLFSTEGKDAHTTEGSASERATNITHERPLCVGYSEIDKYAVQIYQKHFPNHKNYGDITTIDEHSLPDFDLLCGGFPCQSFSIAGKRKGFEDTRGTLFFDLARILKAKQPRLFLFENVKGLLSHDGGRTFKTIIFTLDELGYDLQWQIINSKNHGVPQNRERVFIIGHLRGTRRPEVFPFYEANPEDIQSKQAQTVNCIDANYHKGIDNHGQRTAVIIPEATKQGYALAYEGDSINLSVPNSSTPRGRVGKGIAQTLDTGMQQYTFYKGRVRRLIPLECERVQAFPDNWTDGESDRQRYKMIGNAVTVNVIRDIISKMLYA